MRIVVLEDERPALEDLCAAIARCRPQSVIEATHDSLASAEAWFATQPEPDLVFADVRLTDGRSLDLFARLPLSCPIVFVTAYDRYTLEALEAGGIDYLLKPVEDHHVARALDKVDRLHAHFRTRESGRQRIVVRRARAQRPIDTEDIAWFCTEHRLVYLVTTAGERFVVDQTLSALASELDPRRFFRIGRSWLVSVGSVRAFRPCGKGRLRLELEPPSGQDAIVSAEVAAEFRAWLDR
ncbi:MAG: LytTR family DNA-binding domain-containing protein [Myxococcota bacterium]